MAGITMTPESQRIAVAEACPDRIRQVHGRWQYSDGIHWFNCKDNDPLSDLNAMHEAEKVLTGNARDAYTNYLVMRSISDGDSHVLFATAAQRAEAFLRTLSRWTP